MKKSLLFYLLSPLLLMIPAFYNGYPLVFSDTGTYIKSGMELIIPSDRPIMYGLFIRFFSFGHSLWPVIYVQSLLVTYCLWQISKLSYNRIKYEIFLFMLFILGCFTGLGWYSSQIMADIFTVTTIISFIFLLYTEKITTVQKAIWAGILIFSLNVHFSNFPILITIIFGLLIFKRSTHLFKRIKFIVFLLILTIGTAYLTNFVVNKTFKIGQGSHVFLMGKMLDSGVLKSFLDNNCNENKYVFCECKNSLPRDSRELLWSPDSPLGIHGGWITSNEAYNKLLLGILTSPKHLFLFIYNSFFSSVSQLFQNDLGSGLTDEWYRDPNSPPHTQIINHFQFELNQYNQARQNGNLWNQELKISFVNSVYHIILTISIFFLFTIFLLNKFKEIVNYRTQLIILGLLIANISNAIITASLANVYDRLQARTSWMIIFCALIIFTSNKNYFLNKLKLFLTTPKLQ